VRLLTRRGFDWTSRYPSIAAAVAALACRSCLVDGEVVICGDDGVPVFDRLRYGRQPQSEAILLAFDLLDLAGQDLRRTPLERRCPLTHAELSETAVVMMCRPRAERYLSCLVRRCRHQNSPSHPQAGWPERHP
jgi:hypothetical protein